MLTVMPKNTPPAFQRARQPDQIEQRRETILRVALALVTEKGLEHVTLTDIAREAGTAKSNIYRYFESREHIYLLVIQRLATEWEATVRPPLEKLAGRGTIPQVARIVARAFLKSEQYCMLAPVINTVLEQNLSPALVANFRSVFYDRRQRFAQVLAAALPGASAEAIFPLVLPIFTQVAGLWPLCRPLPASREILKKPEFAHLNLDFETELTRNIEILLRGVLE